MDQTLYKLFSRLQIRLNNRTRRWYFLFISNAVGSLVSVCKDDIDKVIGSICFKVMFDMQDHVYFFMFLHIGIMNDPIFETLFYTLGNGSNRNPFARYMVLL